MPAYKALNSTPSTTKRRESTQERLRHNSRMENVSALQIMVPISQLQKAISERTLGKMGLWIYMETNDCEFC
jgi:hypothetical protein